MGNGFESARPRACTQSDCNRSHVNRALRDFDARNLPTAKYEVITRRPAGQLTAVIGCRHNPPMQTYLVGGAVRDRLLGLPTQDHDWVVVGSTAQAMLDAGYTAVGKDFPVFLHPQTHEEYALARTERKTGAG